MIYSGFFYGNHFSSLETLKKALLIYDEIHFIDRPSITFDDFNDMGLSRVTTFSLESPYKNLDPKVLKGEVRLVCHDMFNHSFNHSGIESALCESVRDDLNNQDFINTFIQDFFRHPWFFQLLFQHTGVVKKYVEKIELQVLQLDSTLLESMRHIPWGQVPFRYDDLYRVDGRHLFDPASRESLQLSMLWFMAQASYVLNSSLLATAHVNAVPFTDIDPYHHLLLSKYSNVVKSTSEDGSKQLTIDCLAHSILDEIINSDSFKHKSVDDIIQYRQRNSDELMRFREYLFKLQYQIENEPYDLNFEAEVQKLITLEVKPKIDEVKERLTQSWENLFGGLAKGISAVGATNMIAVILRDMPLDKLVTVGSGGALLAWTLPAVVGFINDRHRIKRNNGLAYLMKLSQ